MQTERPIKLSIQWLSHLKDSQDKDKFIYKLKSSKDIFERLNEIIIEKIETLDKTNKEDYDKASWAFYQAHKNGAKEALNEILMLTKIQ